MLNHIVIMGRLVRDPELRYTHASVPVTSFTVAVDRDYQSENGERQADFIDCSAWRATAEFISKYFRKGSMIAVSGRLQAHKWVDRDGNNRTGWAIKVDNVYFCGDKKPSSSEPEYTGPRDYASSAAEYSPAFHDISEEDGEMPF